MGIDMSVCCLLSSRVIVFNEANTLPEDVTHNEYTINDFLLKLSYETWDTVFSTDNVNEMFNSFLDAYLKIFYSSFRLKRVSIGKENSNNWITLGILTSCKRKRELLIACRNSNNLDLINYYKKYVKFYLLLSRKQKNLIMLTKLINPSTRIKQFGI
jgi:hypothetical protein